MPILDSIQQAQSRGANPDDIVSEIIKQNPARAGVFQQARSRGADSQTILDEVVKQNTPITPKEPTGFFEKLKADLAQRAEATGVSLDRAKAGQQGIASAALQTAGQGAGFGLDILSRTQEAVTPQFLKNILSQGTQGAINLANMAAGTPISAPTPENLGVTSPTTKANLGALGNIAMLTPAITGAVRGVPKGAMAVKEYVQSRGQKTGAAAFEEALNISRPKVTPKIEQQAFEQGRLGKQGLVKGAPIRPSTVETRNAEALQPLVEQGKVSKKFAPSVNRAAVDTEIKKINAGVKDMLNDQVNNVTFAPKELGKTLNAARKENRLIFAGDETAQKAYDAVIKKFGEFVKTKDLAGLFEARQKFDQYIRTNFPKAFEADITGSVNPRAQALHDVRTSVNEFISEKLPANNPYKFSLKTESSLIRVIENMGTKVKGTSQQGRIGSYFKKHPAIKTATQYGIATAAGGAGATIAVKAIQ